VSARAARSSPRPAGARAFFSSVPRSGLASAIDFAEQRLIDFAEGFEASV